MDQVLNFKSGLFIDNFGKNSDLILEFKEYFEDNSCKKCWHNYGFDRHILFNHGINCWGFGGDTLHMARLLDPSRGPKEYSLSALTRSYHSELLKIREKIFKATLKTVGNSEISLVKTNMSQLFGRYKKLKNGSVGKMIEIPEIIELHTSREFIGEWVNYSTLDSEATFYLKEYLSASLFNLKINNDGLDNLLELYNKYWLPFGELLTEMERTGIRINFEHLQNCQIQAENDLKTLNQKFLDWLQTTQSNDVSLFNMSSVQQLQHLIYAPFKRNNSEIEEEDIVIDSGEIDPETGRKVPKKTIKNSFPEVKSFSVLNLKGEIVEGKSKALKNTEMSIRGFGITPKEFTASGLPSVETDALKELAGDPEKGNFGRAFTYFKEKGKEDEGKEFCKALAILIEKRAIETLIQTFIVPLQSCVDSNNRIHCSLNLNTETGRLSARKPNLQNQPALEKDKYKIRKAFIAEKGNKLIIADYGQLELRILAHMTNCKNMIEAFESGGDFHSRTALGMYKEISTALEKGEILLEWDKSKGKPPAPLLKDKYAAERRKAKTMNFSIAYGKSAFGFSKDWNCSLDEARNELEKWYSSRAEVLEWQEAVKKIALEKGWSQTLLGRFRNLTKYFLQQGKSQKSMVMHGLRAAINTPIQGGAADIVIASMVKLYKNKELKDLSWKILLQIHDELILEGPAESAARAFEIVKHEMENPLDLKLRVKMEVDAKICDNWYDGK